MSAAGGVVPFLQLRPVAAALAIVAGLPVAGTIAAARIHDRCEEPHHPSGRPALVATTKLGDGSVDLEVLFDRQAGRVTVCAVDHASGEPLGLPPDVMSLYVGVASATHQELVRVWLDPVETEADDLGVRSARRFSGASPSLRGVTGFDGLLSCVLVRGTPFWAVKVHVPDQSTDR